jgi:hypothetical protein
MPKKITHPKSYDCQFQAEFLVDALSSVFAGTRTPSNAELVDGNLDFSGDYWQARQFFDGRDWASIELRNFLHNYPGGASSSVNFLSQAGFLHYLPLFMVCVLKNFEESGLLVESLLNRLTLPIDNSGYIHSHDDFHSLSFQQCHIIARFLEYLDRCQSDNFLPSEGSGGTQITAPQAALRSLWSRYL